MNDTEVCVNPSKVTAYNLLLDYCEIPVDPEKFSPKDQICLHEFKNKKPFIIQSLPLSSAFGMSNQHLLNVLNVCGMYIASFYSKKRGQEK